MGKNVIPVFRSAFQSPDDEYNDNLGVRPVVFDILAPDLETSVLPDGLKMVLHVNPTSMSFSWEKVIERIQTKGGYVEQHWGDGARSIDFSMVTGGFKRVASGLSNVTGGGFDTGGTRRETIAYDKYLDMLALFHNNGAIYDTSGSIVFHGILKVTFDGGVYFGWFTSFTANESADKPYQFDLSANFTISHEVLRLRSFLTPEPAYIDPKAKKIGSRKEPEAAPVEDTLVIPPVIPIIVKSEENRPVDPTFTSSRRRSVTSSNEPVATEAAYSDIGRAQQSISVEETGPQMSVDPSTTGFRSPDEGKTEGQLKYIEQVREAARQQFGSIDAQPVR